MKVHIRVGEVVVIVDGLDYTRRQVRALLAAVAMADACRAPEVEERPTVALGFTTERLPDELAAEPGYDDED